MKCCNCDSDNWENVDEYRYKKEGMSICKECGMVSYPNKWKSEKEIKDYYNAEYRRLPNANNLFSSQRKLHYHHAFLEEYLEDWKKRDEFSICDAGAAFGVFLAWFKNLVPNASICGTEWDKNFRTNAFHEYGINLTVDFDNTKKYDLICLYKVAEHMLDFDEKLKEYAACLKDNGLIYISVPVWFDMFYNFGPGNNDLEYYYHPDHINSWSRNILKSIFAKCNLEIVKENITIYDDTYMLKKGQIADWKPFKESYEEIKKKMDLIKKASEQFTAKNFEKVIELYPKTPLAWKGLYESNRKAYQEMGFSKIEEMLKKAVEACPGSSEIMIMCADIYQRYEYYERSIEFINVALKMRPNNYQYLNVLAQCCRGLYGKNGQKKYLVEARNICRFLSRITPENMPEIMSWVYADNCKLGLENE